LKLRRVAAKPEIRRIVVDDRSPPDVWSDQTLCSGDRTSINDVVGLHVYGSAPHTLNYAK
jgi:hypothetical protein